MPQDLIAFVQEAHLSDYIITAIILLIWLLGMLHHILFYFRLAFHKTAASGGSAIPVSVIMVERNEEDNLAKNLPGWLLLGYPDYEVLVVDDFSEDNSLTVVGVLRQNNPRLRLTGLSQETRYSQKLARNLALKAINHEFAVFVHPAMETPDDHWLPGIASVLSGNDTIAVGYTRLKPAKGFYHNLYRTLSFLQQTESMSFCMNGLPYVTTEENIAFRKQDYFAMNGFAGKIGEQNLNMEMIFNEVIRKKKNRLLLSGNLTLMKGMTAGKAEFNDLLHKNLVLKKSLGLRIRLTSGFFDLVRILYFPALITGIVLLPALWPEFAFLFLISEVFRLAGIKRLQNRLIEPGIFISSVIFSVIIPFLKFFIKRHNHYNRRNR